MPRVEYVRPSRVIIEDWVSDDDEDIFQSNDLQATVKHSFKKIEFTKARNEPVKSNKQAVKPRMVNQSPKVDRKDWNGKMTQKLCYSKKKRSRKKSLGRKRAGEKQSEESTKRQKIEDDIENEELKDYLDLVPRE
ncbi:hypothetical protein Tco_0202621, partial [Tanacetum coccineum]